MTAGVTLPVSHDRSRDAIKVIKSLKCHGILMNAGLVYVRENSNVFRGSVILCTSMTWDNILICTRRHGIMHYCALQGHGIMK